MQIPLILTRIVTLLPTSLMGLPSKIVGMLWLVFFFGLKSLLVWIMRMREAFFLYFLEELLDIRKQFMFLLLLIKLDVVVAFIYFSGLRLQ
mmetsp:Transcript_24414/g.37846  ORF Transcript_24414/g.37846 Transcript_24414/m.37846 type:complete len:91 (+) Transcript_24414:1234-1506(+)